MIIDGEKLIKKCPFSTDKKGNRFFCNEQCALYVGQFPYGQCALYLTAINALPNQKDEKDED